MAELTRRYVVLPASPAPFDPRDPDAPFVLKPWKDPAALRAYRDSCYPGLARDLDGWIRLVEAGPMIRGDVGRRNEQYVQLGPAERRPAARRSSTRRPAARPKRRRR